MIVIGKLSNDIPSYLRRTDVVGLWLRNIANYTVYIQRILFHIAFSLHENTRKHT